VARALAGQHLSVAARMMRKRAPARARAPGYD